MSRVDNAARDLLREFDVLAPPVDMEFLAERLDVQVLRSSMPSDVSGMLLRDGDTRAIGLNKSQSSARQRFTLAHEIGHLRLHRGRPLIVDSSIRVNLRDATSATATNREEIEANRFAAALLMPEDMVVEAASAADLTSIDDLQKHLAARFKVSPEAMGYRLVNLGITT